MRLLTRCILVSLLIALCACSPVNLPESNDYQLTAFSAKQYTNKARGFTLQVSAPDAVAGYQTEQMMYMKKPFKLEAFAKNEWTAPPADMLFPLLVQSLQKTGYFYAVTSSPYSEKANYRLDTQLLSLKQNFTKKPSVLEFSAKVVLSNVESNRIVGSQMVSLEIPCPTDTPYGGVVAANQASYQFTATVAQFVVTHLKPH
ncbi:ABC-type transport auxiliary lipoprotein family protein [Legionella waltersii]|uniref:Transport protein n=1 Tax=Legionella waltersii TaxID=66969 RepID=A0A0W1AP29_9GAMM|nr:ABC-type transport auxiliary lipoprotein family protein [Legionella waltersii]KTD83087.1 transport protein [Legionella waltersii]SNV08055.1 ABC transporter auxiliary component [Legionella waltersii]